MKTDKKITIYVLIAILTFGTTAATADEKPILTINPGGHTAMVRELIFTPDGQELISAGDDKVIRVWDVETGELNRTLRGQISLGDEGRIYAAALSPDGRILAVGGYGIAPNYGTIRLFDLVSGDVHGVLKGHTSAIIALVTALKTLAGITTFSLTTATASDCAAKPYRGLSSPGQWKKCRASGCCSWTPATPEM